MRTTSRLFAALALICLAAPWPRIVHAQPAIVIKFSHVVAPNTPKGQAAEKFKQLVEARSGGKIKVQVYPNSQLFKDLDEIQALQLNSVQIIAPSLSKFGPLGTRAFEVFDLPFLFPDKAGLYRVMEGEVGKRLFAQLESKGIKGLAYWDNGYKQMHARKPLRKPEDLRGLKLRIQSSKLLEAQMRAVGASPQVLAFSEVYHALQTGAVDGGENTLSNIYTQKMHEVQPHLTLSNHGYIGYGVITNKKFWDGLPGDARSLLEQAMQEATAFEREMAQKDNDEALAQIRASKKTTVYALSEAERKAWQQAMQPVWKQFESGIGKDLLAAIQQTTQSK
jgi:C4-dicarboxylate-binding protein DctP